MHIRTVCSTLLIGLFLLSGQTWGMGFILGQTKEELKLQYDVTVHDPGTGRVIVVFTLVDEGRLKPLDAVELIVPCKEQDPGGGRGVDLSVSMRMTKDAQGKQTARIEITKEMAGRAEIWLTTTTMDGKRMVMERSHHVIPLAKFLNQPAKEKAAQPAENAPAEKAQPPAAKG